MKRLFVGTMCAGAVLALAACGSSGSGSASSGSSGTIAIGAWSPLSGPIAPSGTQVTAGAKAAFDEVNAAGGINGKKIEYTTLDNAFDAQQTIQTARKLVGEKKVVAIVGADGTAATAAAFPYVLKQSKVPILFTYGGSSTWYDPPQAGLFGAQTLYENQAAALAGWAVSSGAKHIVVVHDDPAAFLNVANHVVSAAKEKDPAIQTDLVPVKLNTTDYSPVVAQVKAKSPDAVVLILPVPEAAAYLKQAKLQGVTAQPYGYAPDADPGLLKLAGDAAEGFRTLSLTKLPTDTADPAVAGYVAALKKSAPDQVPSFYSIYSYAAAKAFIKILQGIKGDITAASISQAAESASGIDTGLLPPLSFSADKHLGTDQVIRLTVTGGAFAAQGGFTSPTGS
ncbi:MAG TPA: ABC transporter substrate-binding protein [Mycobacteriales bacterium]|nr:ABC transporter substrate-binding protein [Mycobacteriales bacterium]